MEIYSYININIYKVIMDNNIEWKDVPIEEFKNSYEVSNDGKIRNKNTLKIKTTQ